MKGAVSSEQLEQENKHFLLILLAILGKQGRTSKYSRSLSKEGDQQDAHCAAVEGRDDQVRICEGKQSY